DAEALADLAEQILLGNDAVLENQLAGRRDFFLGCGLFAYRINNVRNLRLVKTAFLLERAPCGTGPRSLRGPAGEFAGRSRWKTGTVLYFFCTFAI
ncbi:hypothetical protein, partial [Alistipes finegoldii]|uniref:hypothetical protein n=1 Tax=Alistipes finegoldii TaxID=214856 RepID=UPI003AB429D5